MVMKNKAKERYYEKNIDTILDHSHELYLRNRENKLEASKNRTQFIKQHTSNNNLIEAKRILQEMGLKS